MYDHLKIFTNFKGENLPVNFDVLKKELKPLLDLNPQPAVQ
jgi:hypothetical protein